MPLPRKSMSKLLDQLADWKPFTAIVIGDFMLDQLVFGNADRLSPEAPVPILAVQRTEDRPGGAANVCLDLFAMRATVHTVGVTGDDREADLLRSARATGNLAQDAWLAALAVEHGCEWITSDGDFARFSDLRWKLL